MPPDDETIEVPCFLPDDLQRGLAAFDAWYNDSGGAGSRSGQPPAQPSSTLQMHGAGSLDASALPGGLATVQQQQ